jgi:hypothetical protein
MNDGLASGCGMFTWVATAGTSAGTAYIELTWPAAVTIGSFYIETVNSLGTAPACGTGAGRNVASGTVQAWNGQTWVTVGGFSGQGGQFVQYNLPSMVSTTALRIYGLAATAGLGNGNSVIFQWHVYSRVNCMPPP